MSRPARWFWCLWVTSIVLTATEGLIDGQFPSAFGLGYTPHHLAAKLLATANALISVPMLVLAAIVAVRWARRRLAA